MAPSVGHEPVTTTLNRDTDSALLHARLGPFPPLVCQERAGSHQVVW
jgi:hypothetical protein